MTLEFTRHGEKRANQRAFRPSDIELIRRYGTFIRDRKTDENYLLRCKDADRAVRSLKKEIQRLERLRGCQAVIIGNKLVTVCRPDHKHERMLLRRAS